MIEGLSAEQNRLVLRLCSDGTTMCVDWVALTGLTANNKVSLGGLTDDRFIDLCGGNLQVARETRRTLCMKIKELQLLFDIDTIPDDIGDVEYMLLVNALPELKDKLAVRDVSALEARFYGTDSNS